MNSEKYHNKLVNADRVEQCTFSDTDYSGDLEPNEIFAIGLAETQGESDGLKQWLLQDHRISESSHLNTQNKIHVKTERATYIFEYDSDDYSMNIGATVVCKITAKEFEVHQKEIPRPVLEVADAVLAKEIETQKKSGRKCFGRF